MGVDSKIWLVTGNDEAAIEVAARALVAKLAGADPEPGALELFRDRDDLKDADIIYEAVASICSPPFLLDCKTIWLHKTSGFAPPKEKKEKTDKKDKKKTVPPDVQALNRLVEVIGTGVPSGIQIVVSGPDGEKVLGETFRRVGQVQVCMKPDPRDRGWQASMAALIRTRAKEKNMVLAGDAVEYLVSMLGTDTLRLDGELEKLACYVGAGKTVGPADVELLCRGEGGEVSPFALNEAIGKRNLRWVWHELQTVLEREKDPETAVLGILFGLHNQFRSMLQIRVFQQAHKTASEGEFKRAVEGLAGEAKAEALRSGFEFITYHSFRVQKLYEAAMNYSGPELVRSVPLIRDAFWKCVSGGASNKQVLLEDLVVQLVGKK